MNKPKISLIVSGNLYMRQMRFDQGDVEQGHSHTYDHLTLLSAGSMKVSVDGTETVFVAPTAIKILAHKTHQLEALEDNTLAYCVHALRDAVTEDVLPPQAAVTDRVVPAIAHVEDGVMVKPLPTAVEVDGHEVEVASIAFIPKNALKPENFNRNHDDNPLKVLLPTGKAVDKEFV